jgi:hypothetical protein
MSEMLPEMFEALARDSAEAIEEAGEAEARFLEQTAANEDTAVQRILDTDREIAQRADAIRDQAAQDGNATPPGALTGWARQSGVLRSAAAGKGNFGLGSATADEAESLGRAWVGNGYRVASDGKTLVSRDGMRQFRPPSYKPTLGTYQANFEQRMAGQMSRQWFSNGHLDISDLP